MKKEQITSIIILSTILFLIIFIISILFKNLFFSITDKEEKKNTIQTSTTQKDNNKTIPKGQVGIVSHQKSSLGMIELIIKNNTDKTLDLITITAETWDKDGNNLGIKKSYLQDVNNIDNFKTSMYIGSDTYKYKLSLKYQ